MSAVSDFQLYQLAQSRVETARAEYEAASLRLELELVRCRFAELCSQHEPKASIIKHAELDSTNAILAAARFVMTGRPRP